MDEKIIIFHSIDAVPSLDSTSRWTGNNSAGILAWAAEIPYGPPAELSISFTTHNVCQPPQLLPPHHQIVPPSLCTNTPQVTPPPSSPLLTPKPHHFSSVQPSDTSRVSLKSVLSESSLATPPSSHSPISTIQQPLNLGCIYSHVRSWVIPSPALTRSTSAAKVKALKLSAPARNTRVHSVKVVSPPDTPHGFLDEGVVHWKASTVLFEQPHVKCAPEHQPREYRLPHKFPLTGDQDLSFRARGRKASRAVD